MLDNISASELIKKIISWRKKFLYITIAAALVSGVVAFLIPKQYKSTVIIFPARQFSVSKLVIEANAGNQEDYMMFGDADDAEKVMQLLNSDVLKMKVADAFNLWNRWRINDTVIAYHYLKQRWDDQVTIKRTEYNSIKIDVYDYTADSAAFVANGIAAYIDSVRWDMNREVAGKVVKIVKGEYDNTLLRMKELEDSLQVLRSMGVMHYKEQVLTAVLGQLLGTRFAEKAKNRDANVIRNNEFKKTTDLMPELLKEMYTDFNSSAKREFFVIISKSISFNSQDYVAYYQDEHKELTSKIGYLKDKGFIIDITHTKTPKYRITEEFLDYVKKYFET